MLKSRRQTCPAAPTGAAPGVYSGVLDCFVKTFKADGPLAFYNGALAEQWFKWLIITGDALCVRLGCAWSEPADLRCTGPCWARWHAHARRTAAKPAEHCCGASFPTACRLQLQLRPPRQVRWAGARQAWGWAGGAKPSNLPRSQLHVCQAMHTTLHRCR